MLWYDTVWAGDLVLTPDRKGVKVISEVAEVLAALAALLKSIVYVIEIIKGNGPHPRPKGGAAAHTVGGVHPSCISNHILPQVVSFA